MTKREIELDRTICRRGHTVSGIEERTGTRVTGTLLGAHRDDDPEVRFVCGEDGIYAIYERTMRRADKAILTSGNTPTRIVAATVNLD